MNTGNEVELLDGEGACPPEDSNGLDGKGGRSSAEFLERYTHDTRRIASEPYVTHNKTD